MSRILIYAMNYAPEMAGVGRYTGEIGDDLVRNGHEVIVVTTPPHYPGWKLRLPYRPFRWLREQSNLQTIIRCPLFIREKMGGIWRLIAPLSFAISSFPVVFWQIITRRPDVVLCIEPTLFGAPTALLAAGLVGARRVLHVQDLEVDAAFAAGHLARSRFLKSLGHAFERFCLKRFDQVITISKKMADQLAFKGINRGRLAIVRNWVDLELISPLSGPSPYRLELGLDDTDIVVLYSGNIGAKQDFGTVLEVATLLSGWLDIKFVVAGEGPMKEAIESERVRLKNLIVLPFQPYERLSEFLGLADIHLLPQTADAADLVLPSKLGGMLASGKSIVVTASTETELADFLGSTVTFAKPGSAAAIADAIFAALGTKDDEEKRDQRLQLARTLDRRDGLRAFSAQLLSSANDGTLPPVGKAHKVHG